MEHLLFLFVQLRMLCHYKEKHRTNGLSWAPAPTIKIYVQSHRCNGIGADSDLRNIFQLPCTTTLAIVCGQKSDDMV